METTHRRILESRSSVRRIAGAFTFVAFLVVTAFALPAGGATGGNDELHTSLAYFRTDFWRTVRADQPLIRPVANAIRAVTSDPLQQIVMVNDVTTLLVEYDSDMRVYGVDDYHATLDEMIARRRAAGWAYLRDDCDGRAVFAAHLLAALGIPWRLEASYWKGHAWVVARVNGRDYDLLDLRDNAPETRNLGYKLVGHFFVHPTRTPPMFDWREAWAARTHHNLKIGITLGMLTLDSTKYAMHTRHAKDWTVIAPDARFSPPDDAHVLLAGVAGFPYGEHLSVAALASNAPKPKAMPESAAAAVIGGATSANVAK